MKEENKNILLSFLGAALFWIPLMVIIVYSGHKNNYEYCDTINADILPAVCKLRYPVLNTEEISKLKEENENLKTKIRLLETRLEEVKDVLDNGKEDRWEADPIQRDY